MPIFSKSRYDTPKGTVITSVQSVSQNGNHVFQVPMFDPQNIPSSAGGFPWKVDGDFTTVVYIKNETDIARKYTAHLIHEGGQYSMGASEIKPRQTVAIDFRELRDSQTPDGMGRIIPPHVERGQIGWGVQGAENKILSARSEQISVAGGVASTYSCPSRIGAMKADVHNALARINDFDVRRQSEVQERASNLAVRVLIIPENNVQVTFVASQDDLADANITTSSCSSEEHP